MPNRNAYLKEIGIDVWVEREPSIDTVIQPPAPIVEAELNTSREVEKNTSIEVKENINSDIISKTNTETLNWDDLRSHVAECQLCDLSKQRQHSLFSSGIQTASLMIVGDSPTVEDENNGDVFSGAAGQLLSAMLKAMSYQRNDVYITNFVKCKTEENQESSDEQAASCEPYLLRQINLLKPKLILVFGLAAAQRLLKNKSTMSRLRGQLHYADGINIPILVSYHPSYLLAAPNEKRKAWEDLQLAMKELDL